ncbi:uncharacterized protein EAF01_008780 [Botrytis porri]|uniref:uncharacterized protein n=1 Tax=Botrytis porri TaxID=87229 RepID=UPI001901290B|nr:uncharacterized protein EAF01_008780 [Botrytis porri]KAF7897814.1 hypothetical protein EAF01_008780 [Botrytis porri]
MLAIDNTIAICFGLTSVLLAILSLYIMCKPRTTPDMPEPDLESGLRNTSLPLIRANSISASSSLPGRAPSIPEYSSLPGGTHFSVHNEISNNPRSIRATLQRATNQFQDFAVFVPALTFTTVEPPPKPTIELYQLTHSARFISYNQSWG